MIGTTLGHYRILESLGVGGMGEVFAAQDTKLDRKVALKVLPASVAADPDRRERFAREAKAVAALNHPNIVTVHSVEESGDTYFLTMELVEGRTLADLIPAKGLPLDQLLKFAVPLADAVSAAHARGITHRDLKPANVMVTADGRVKVLDFGLAKLAEAAPAADSMTALRTSPLTGEGRIVGTVSYMSPEQAEGKAVDHRSDIFSLGVMLYEMSTGERPFKGDSNVSTLSAILRDTPRSVTEINPGMPRDLGKVIRRALAKDPEQRYQSAKDLRNELRELKQELESGELLTPAAIAAMGAAAVSRARRRVNVISLWGGAGIVAIGTAVTVWILMSSRQGGQPASAPLQVTFTQVTSAAGIETTPSLSPDGKWVVYSNAVGGGASNIFLQSAGKLSGQAPFNLTKDQPDQPANNSEPAFSPDGESIAFRSSRGGGGIFVMDRTGGGVKRLTDGGHDPAWTPDGRFVIYSTDGVTDPDGRNAVSEGWKVDVETLKTTQLTAGDFIQPAVSPHQQRIAYWALPVSTDAPLRITGGNRDVWTMRLDGSQPVRVTDRSFAMNWSPVWSRDGRFVFFASDRGGSMNLWRVAIDEASGKVLGQPEAITTPSQWIGLLALSGDGHRLAYAAYDFSCNIARVPFDPVQEKVVGPPEDITTGTLCWSQPDPSPDGTRVVFTSFHRQEDLYLARMDASGGWKASQLTSDPAKDRGPRWSPDGKQIAYYSNRGDEYALWTIDPDGSRARARVAMRGAAQLFPVWSPDGARFVSADLDAKLNYVFALNDTVASAPMETLPHLPDANMAFTPRSWSTDGRRIAGSAGGSVWVYSFDTKAFTPVTPGGQPAWLADGKRLVYSAARRLRLVDTATKQLHEIYAIPGETLLSPGLTKDNRFLYYQHATTGADIWVMTIK